MTCFRLIWSAVVLAAKAVTAAACSDTALQNRDWQAYNQSRYEACSAALAGLNAAQNTLNGVTYDSITASEIRRIGAQYAAYERGCFETMADLKCATQDILRSQIGGLFSAKAEERDTPICTVLRIDDRHVMTARHCLFAENMSMTETGFQVSILNAPAQRLTVLGERHTDKILNGRAATDPCYGDLEDVAVLEVAFEDDGFVSALPVATIEKDARVLIPAIFTPELALRDVVEPGTWAEAFRVDIDPACKNLDRLHNFQKRSSAPTRRVRSLYQGKRRQACIVTSCQTFKGMSGAPILSLTKDRRLFLGGVFIGQGASTPRDCQKSRSCRHDALDDYNLGVSLPDGLRPVLGNTLEPQWNFLTRNRP